MTEDSNPAEVLRLAGRTVMVAAVIAAAVFAFVALAASDGSDATGGNVTDTITWDITGDTLTISGTGAIPDYLQMPGSTAPWRYTDEVRHVTVSDGITRIGNQCFLGNYWVESFTLGKDVTSVGERAFEQCGNVAAMTIHCVNLQEIGTGAIDDFTKISTLEISEGVHYVPAIAMCSTELATVTIPTSATDIAAYAFDGADKLTHVIFKPLAMDRTTESRLFPMFAQFTVEFAQGITIIPAHLFDQCFGLTSVTIPATVTEIQSHAFSDCGIKSAVIPDSVKTIGSYAFALCSSMETLTIGKSVESIGYSAFDRCIKLREITIPASVTHISGNCFFETRDLTEFNFYPTVNTGDVDSEFGKMDYTPVGFQAYFGPGSVIPKGFMNDADCKTLIFDGKSIEPLAFNRFSGIGLERIVFGSNIESISADSFEHYVFKDADGNVIELTPDNVRDRSFVSTDTRSFVLETYTAPDTEEPESHKNIAIGLTIIIAVIAAGMVIAFARKH